MLAIALIAFLALVIAWFVLPAKPATEVIATPVPESSLTLASAEA